jgi:hypothetical protein
MFLIRNPLKWGLFSALVFFILLSWGSNFIEFYQLFYDHLPKFKMFRTPSMALTMPALIMSFVGFWGLKELFDSGNKKQLLKPFVYAASITIGVILLVGFAMKGSYDFQSSNDLRVFGDQQVIEIIKKDRVAMLNRDALRSLLFVAGAAIVLWAFISGRLRKPVLAGSVIGALVFADLFFVNKRYLNEEDFKDKQQYEAQFQPSAIEREIAQREGGKRNYRVHDLTTDAFNNAMQSYNKNSIGGYHPTKLIRYQDLIEQHISKGTMPVLNMLNTKYFIVPNEATGQKTYQLNPNAAGNAWFVSEVDWVASADEEMAKLADFDPRRTVIVDERYRDYFAGFELQFDSSASITVQQYEPGHIVYNYSASREQFAVFSEVYYGAGNGWKVKVNNEPAEHIRVNYVLRGMRVPAGSGTIEFTFRPDFYVKSEKAALAGSVVLVLFVAGMVWMEWRNRSGKKAATS